MAVTTTALPQLDLGAYRAGVPAAREMLAGQLREALEQVGFFCIVDHGILWDQVEGIYEQAARYHALPLDLKLPQQMSASRMGYNHLGDEQYDGRRPALNAAFFMARPESSRNQWPDEEVLPGFRAACTAYYEAMDRLCHDWLLPLYAVALDLEPTWFQAHFAPSLATLRLSHYPPLPAAENQWGIDPHTDAGFMTLLPSNPVEGFWIRPAGSDWFQPPQEPESFVVNSGDMLRRWTNDRFLSTLHRALNTAPTDRYAVPFFYDPRVDTVIECLPSCCTEGRPPRHAPIVYRDYLRAFMNRSYQATREEV
jgi:isopenicillin N synthase-like dioxygenase